jgi:hypothetical protein
MEMETGLIQLIPLLQIQLAKLDTKMMDMEIFFTLHVPTICVCGYESDG